MAEAQPAAGSMSQELVERIKAHATEHFNHMKANATPEQQALYAERFKKNMSDTDYQNEQMANFTEDWNGSDADGDGKLNLAEFTVWMGKAKAREQALGQYVRPDEPGRIEEFYNLVNAVNEGDGATMMDIFAVFTPWYGKYVEIFPEATMPQALQDQIKAFAAERYNEFKANATAEQQAHYWEYMAKLHDPTQSEHRETVLGKAFAEWNAAGTDGVLNQEQFRAWMDAARKRRQEEGFYVSPDPLYDEHWNIMNAVNPGSEGVKINDFFLMMTPFHAKWKELKNSSE